MGFGLAGRGFWEFGWFFVRRLEVFWDRKGLGFYIKI